MKIYAFSAELESAVIELLEDTTFLLSQLPNSDTPAYVKALRHLKATRPSVFQIRSTGAQIDHPGDKMMWEILGAREPKPPDCSDEPELGKENLRSEPEWVVDSEILYGKRG
jgi:hypothetical protein